MMFHMFSGIGVMPFLMGHVFPQVVGTEAHSTTYAFAKVALVHVVVTFLSGRLL